MNIFSKTRDLQKKSQVSLTSIVSAVEVLKIFKGLKGMKIIALSKVATETCDTTCFLVSTENKNGEASCKKPSPANTKQDLEHSDQCAKEKVPHSWLELGMILKR